MSDLIQKALKTADDLRGLLEKIAANGDTTGVVFNEEDARLRWHSILDAEIGDEPIAFDKLSRAIADHGIKIERHRIEYWLAQMVEAGIYVLHSRAKYTRPPAATNATVASARTLADIAALYEARNGSWPAHYAESVQSIAQWKSPNEHRPR